MIIDRGQLAAALPGYELRDQLGAGHFGLVLAGRHRHLERDVAIKVLAVADEGADDRFTAEARLLAHMDHPYIVRVYDYVEHDGLRLIIMELLSGGSLSRRLAGISPKSACAVAIAVAEALSYAHARGVLHRDIKPDNVLFNAGNILKVTDFGIAKIFDGSAATASAVAGTPAYMAPEQIIGGHLGPTTDIYALGVVLYEMLAGTSPFDPKLSLLKRYEQQLTSTPLPPAGVPSAVADVVMHALAREMKARPPSAEAFAVELTEAVDLCYGHNSIPDSRTAPHPPTVIGSGTDRAHQFKTWSDALDSRRAPEVVGLATPSDVSRAAGVASVTALAGWVAFATLLAYFTNQHWWLGIAAASGFLSLLLVRRDLDYESPGLISVLVTLALYIATASVFTDSWLVRSFIIGILLLFIPIAFGRWLRMLSVSSAEIEWWKRRSQQPIVDAMKHGRWLAGDSSHPESALLDQLGEVPAARFASMNKGRFRFAVIAGNRVLLVGFATWPPGKYTRTDTDPYAIRRNGKLSLAESDELARIASEAGEWRSTLSKSTVRVVLVIRPTHPSAAVVVRLDEADSDIMLTTPDTFADAAGSFLVEGAYELNIPALEQLLSRVGPDRRS